jgi:hypothetical protein
MRARNTVIGFAACAAIAAGCGDDGGGKTAQSESKAKTVSVAERHALLRKDPYALRCSDIRDKLASADITRTVQVALADDAKIRGLNQFQASQGIYYAITELCKAKPGSYQPAEDAIAGVRTGEFRAEL